MSVRKDAYVWAGVGVLLAAVVAVAAIVIGQQQQATTVRLGDGVFRAQVVSTDEARAKGLGGVDDLRPQDAMLFVYETDGQRDIWMKDMQIPIDVVWLDASRRVVHIEQALQPDSYPQLYGPARATRYVIEFTSGTVQQKAISIGMQAEFTGKAMGGVE